MSQNYPRSSRYYGIDTATYTEADGSQTPYLRRRLLPRPDSLNDAGTGGHVVRAGDRLDLIAAAELGAADQWWQVADANPALDPRELTATPGRVLRITLPAGVPGIPGVGGDAQ